LDGIRDDLGDDHHLAVFAEKLRVSPEQFGDVDDVHVLEGLIAQHCQTGLRRGSFLFAEDTNALA